MKKLFILLLSLLITSQAFSQDIRKINLKDYLLSSKSTSIFYEDKEAEFIAPCYPEIYILGWSKDGKFAFMENRGIEGRGGCDLIFTILDLVKDSVEYTKVIRWYDDDGYGDNPKKALTLEQCIAVNADTFNKELEKAKIILKPAQMQLLPATDNKGNKIDFKIDVIKKEIGEYNLDYMTYEIKALKGNVSKTVNLVKQMECTHAKVTGYIKSPYEDRVAVIVATSQFVWEGYEVFLDFYGCNLKVGFN